MLTPDRKIIFRKKNGEQTELESKLRDSQNHQKNQKKIHDNRAVVLKYALMNLNQN